MRFDWIKFLERHKIPYVTDGPNFSRKMLCNVRCPFCGDADPSEHMGLSSKGWWGCLRNAGHRGKSPHFLIQKLIGCSLEEARRIVGVAEEGAPTTDELAESFAALLRVTGEKRASERPRELKLPSEFRRLDTQSPFAEPFWDYLYGRGFRSPQIQWLTENYNLQYALRGRYAYRIIVPVYDRYERLLTWTARSILDDAKLRYDTLRSSGDPDDGKGPIALAPDKEVVLGLPVLYSARNPKVLVLVEGPFDALKLTAYGRGFGVYGAALFGLNISDAQIAEVLELSGRFEKTVLLLDAGAELQRLRLSSVLSVVPHEIIEVPQGFSDPGELTPAAIAQLSLDLLNRQA